MIKGILNDSIDNISKLRNDEELLKVIREVSEVITNSVRNGGTLFTAGNGGSAADAQHIAAEFLGKFMIEREPLSATALTVNTSAITAIGNDYGYEYVFSRQLKGLGKQNDVIIGISTSGNSKNILEAFAVAKDKEIYTVALVGEKDCKMAEVADYVINVPSKSTPRIQEMHILVGHIICEIVEKNIFGE